MLGTKKNWNLKKKKPENFCKKMCEKNVATFGILF
jgi:hypothetical protein